MKQKFNLIYLIAGSIILAFLSVFLFTRPAFLRSFVFTETGQIGDTIGGITSPIFGLIGFILVFYSFKEQYKANRIQITALEEEKKERKGQETINLLTNLIENLDDKIDLFEIYEKKPTKDVNQMAVRMSLGNHDIVYLKQTGSNAIRKFCKKVTSLRVENFNDKFVTIDNFEGLADFYYLIKYLGYINTKLQENFMDNENYKLLHDRFNLIFKIKLKEPLYDILESYRKRASRIEIFEEMDEIKKLIEKN